MTIIIIFKVLSLDTCIAAKLAKAKLPQSLLARREMHCQWSTDQGDSDSFATGG